MKEPKMKKTNLLKCEQGRSMVEMLGVLAVMGVLSVAGIAGYNNAMNKHRANELLNEASKRATVVAAQVLQERETLSISEFGTENTRLNFSETVDYDTANKQFTLTITGVAEAVCQQMKNAMGPVIRKFAPATCADNATVQLTFNDDMSTTEKASDYNGDPDHCPGKYCTGSNTCVDTGADCTCSGTTPECQTCDTDTGSYVADSSQDGNSCNSGAGTCNNGTCVVAPTCSRTIGDDCDDNSTVCEGYYCSIAGGTTDNDEWCGTDTYTPGSGSVAALGTPNTKGSYKASPSPVASWDAAVNYCAALGRDGLVTHGRLVNVPSDCSMGNSCSALPNDGYYWLDGLVQWDCDWGNYSTTYGSNSCLAFYVGRGNVYASGGRYSGIASALCE